MKLYKQVSEDVWQGRVDEKEVGNSFRLHQKVMPFNLEEDDHSQLSTGAIGILGFRSDEGVRRNFGRTGAAQGPEYLRRASANLAWHFENKIIYDFGDIVCDKHDLENAHQQLSQKVEMILKAGVTPVLLGGGHEISFGHYLGVRNALKGKIGIVNIDAHFDLRKPSPSATSGTPFYQIAELENSNENEFKYLVLGIQESSNTQVLFERADHLNVTYLKAEELHSAESLVEVIKNFAAELDHIYLTICLDAFDVSISPGVSAPSVGGISLQDGIKIIDSVMKTSKLASFDIAELNPDHDIDNRTAKLGARLMYEVLSRSY